MVRSEPWRRTTNPQKREARKLLLPRAYSASAGPFPRSPLKDINIVCSVPFCVNRWDRPPGDSSGVRMVRSEPWRRTANHPSAQRESSSSLEPTQRAEARCRAALIPRSPPKTVAERCRSVASLGGEQQIPQARSAKALPPQSLLSERRTIPAKHQLAQAHRRPLTPRAPFRIGASL